MLDARGAQEADLSRLPVRAIERRVAFITIALSTLVFAAAAPFARVPLPHIPAFIPSYEAALAINDLITAIILFGQFTQLRSTAVLALASGYLFDALMMVFHALSFPGVFADAGVLGGGPQTTAWLYMFWHAGFPLAVVAYAALGGGRVDPSGSIGRTATLAVLFVATVASALALLATSGQGILPRIMAGSGYTPAMMLVVSSVWALSLVALLVLWRRPRRSVLDLRLMVVMCAWLFDIALSAVLNSGRYDLGFYVGRLYGLLAASFVLGALLIEMIGLYGRLARAQSKLEDHARGLEARVRTSTAELERSGETLKAEVAQREEVEAQLRHSQKLEAIGTLTGGMAHDFNNLLSVIIGNLDMLRGLVRANAAADELASDALEAALRGADLTRRLLAFARRQPLQPARINVNDLVDGITKLLRRTLGERIEIDVKLAAEVWPVIADPAQLEAALTNLATNARDAMPDGGRLTIVTGSRVLDGDYASLHAEIQPGDFAMIEVSDTGTGMPPDVLSHIFEPFFTTKEQGKGSGLGLSMVFGFMKQSGGHINVYSEPGIGTTFRLYLPRAAQDAAIEAPMAAAEVLVGSGETVLAVEDSAPLRRIVVRQITELGYRVLEADNAAAAFAILEREHVDLVFTDVVMPGELSGLELARTAVERWPHIRVVLTSGFPGAKIAGSLGDTVAARLLSKPYRKADLARALRAVLAD